MLEMLGIEGMSSDEEEIVNGERMGEFLVHQHPWRGTDGTNGVRFLDSEDKSTGNQTNRGDSRGGTRRNRRVPTQPILSTRRATMETTVRKGLPRNLYDWGKLETWKAGVGASASWNLRDILNPGPDNLECVRIPAISGSALAGTQTS